jgi:hypothetical protein
MDDSTSRAVQTQVCDRFGVKPAFFKPGLKVGVARNVQSGLQPINGLRHPPERGTSGWYIWAGGEFSDAPDFFQPLHAEHLIEWCPEVIPYLSLPPGWRFLIAPGIEDVWADSELLKSN